MKKIIILISAVLLISLAGCEKINTETGTRIEVKVTKNGSPVSGVHGYLYDSSGICNSDTDRGEKIQEAISTDDDVIFGELEADKTYYVVVEVNGETSGCRSVKTIIDEIVTVEMSL